MSRQVVLASLFLLNSRCYCCYCGCSCCHCCCFYCCHFLSKTSVSLLMGRVCVFFSIVLVFLVVSRQERLDLYGTAPISRRGTSDARQVLGFPLPFRFVGVTLARFGDFGKCMKQGMNSVVLSVCDGKKKMWKANIMTAPASKIFHSIYPARYGWFCMFVDGEVCANHCVQSVVGLLPLLLLCDSRLFWSITLIFIGGLLVNGLEEK